MGITFDPSNLYINITSPTVSATALDLYNAAMNWTDQLENASYTVPMDASGKFPMGGGVSSDSIFRLINGWKLSPWVAGQMIRVTGTIITDDETVRWVYPGGNVGMEFQVSSQATVVETGISGVTEGDLNDMADKVWDEAVADHQTAGSTGEALSAATAPTASEVADAVLDEALVDHQIAGSAGKQLSDIPISNPSATDVADAVLDEALTDHQIAGSLGEAVEDIRQESVGKWVFDDATKTLTIYDRDNSTPRIVIEMQDADGNPTLEGVYKRIPQ